ncbi:MFS general substrate transporter [Suhomyces tanzawaensis NRRL Y-17324]|uniref:MFS general substrate transporter n=1 Tax=Suhomyces tanzawaensis NRRL Y-17324 TaxID=984487 RepID=A0A1E4SE67_9ASCO|nr:MFS general substrate transporter [Suhomyces tanzawaensis NRRL Y-17324]ODV77778.1 MFS general substrate transporter [Suhomyces tanzawaensis NRRL Y-17324]
MNKDEKAIEINHEVNRKSSVLSFDTENANQDALVGSEIAATPEIEEIYFNKTLERLIVRKLDFKILPVIAVMYLFNALDKGNISNAKTDHIDKDLGIKGQQWNLMLSIFYIPFVLCGLPFSLLVRKYNAANAIPVLMFTFGCITLLAVSAFNFGSLLVARLFLGACESSFLPSIIYYLSTFYRRRELATRISIFYAASAIANAFSGLLAFGCFQINSKKLHGWQILFLIEGSLTISFAVFAFIVLPRDTQTTSVLNDEEKEYAAYRIKTDSSDDTSKKVSFRDAMKVFKHPVVLLWMLVEVCIGVPLNSINNWFPQIIGVLGKSTVQTNLYTVAPNVWGAVVLVVLAVISDKVRIRSIFVCFAVLCTLVGFAVFGAIDVQAHLGVAYFSCFLMTMGASASSVLTSTWYTNNTPGANRRAVISAVGVPLANAAGLISTNIFLPKDAPKYIPALGITAGFGGLAIVVILCILLFMIYDNRRRNKEQGVNRTFEDVPTYILSEGPNNINFRWMY